MPFGVASASAIFQRTIESILQGILFVVMRADDILVSGIDDADHLANLKMCCSSGGSWTAGQACKVLFMVPEIV